MTFDAESADLLLPLLVPDRRVVVDARHDGRLAADDDAALLREDAISDTPRRGPNQLEIDKETTLMEVRWPRVVSVK